MRESPFTRSAIKKLPREDYARKLNARYAPGEPDCWYSGINEDHNLQQLMESDNN